MKVSVALHMLDKIYCWWRDGQIFTFAYSKGALLYSLVDSGELHSEAIYLAQVSKYNKSSQNAFVKYGDGQSGLVNLRPNTKVQEGSLLALQLSWPGDAQKQPRLRSEWRIVGKYCVYFARSSYCISGASALQLAKVQQDILLQLYPGHWVIRSAFRVAQQSDLLAEEMQLIYSEVSQIQQVLGARAKAGLSVYPGVPNYLKLLRSLPLAENCTLTTNNSLINQQLLLKQNLWQIDSVTFDPQLACAGLIENYGQEVILNNGATLEIHSLSGIHLLDINGAGLNISHAQLNFLVLDEVHRQVCLRNLQGIILLDLVKNMKPTDEARIINYLERLFKSDITNTKILGFTKAGLCEIIRERY